MSEAVREIYDASYPRLVGQLTAVTGSRSEAEDVVQEAFVRALARERSFLATDNPEAWLRVVAVNLARSRWRRARRLVGLLPDLMAEPPAALGPERVALWQALQQLPRGQREVIALHHLADLPVVEVAKTLGIPDGTVKARLSRGRRALVTLLAPDTDLDDPEVTHG